LVSAKSNAEGLFQELASLQAIAAGVAFRLDGHLAGWRDFHFDHSVHDDSSKRARRRSMRVMRRWIFSTAWKARLRRVSVIGTSHIQTKQPCQDYASGRILDADTIVLVCADGAGSASRSEVGSRFVCTSLLNIIATALENGLSLKDITRERVVEWHGTVSSPAESGGVSENVDLREFATTILTAIVGPSNALFSHIGDGVIVYGEGDEYRTPFWPQQGEYANTTYFLTGSDFEDQIALRELIARSTRWHFSQTACNHSHFIMPLGSVHSPFFQPMFTALRGAGEAWYPTEKAKHGGRDAHDRENISRRLSFHEQKADQGNEKRKPSDPGSYQSENAQMKPTRAEGLASYGTPRTGVSASVLDCVVPASDSLAFLALERIWEKTGSTCEQVGNRRSRGSDCLVLLPSRTPCMSIIQDRPTWNSAGEPRSSSSPAKDVPPISKTNS